MMMARRRLSLALCLLGVAACVVDANTARSRQRSAVQRPAVKHSAAQQPADTMQSAAAVAPAATKARPSRSVSPDRWFSLISDYQRSQTGARSSGSSNSNWFPRIVPLELPLDGDRSVPVLVLPVPVPVPAAGNACTAEGPAGSTASTQQSATPPAAPSSPPSAVTPRPSFYSPPDFFTSNTGSFDGNDSSEKGYDSTNFGKEPSAPPTREPTQHPHRVIVPVRIPRPRPSPPPEDNVLPEVQELPSPPFMVGSRPISMEHHPLDDAPQFGPVEDSALLVEQYRAQTPLEPELPPVVLDGQTSETSAPPPGPACSKQRLATDATATPPLPRFERSLYLRARLHVPRADYTEPYQLWWDAASGSSRVDFHSGTASSYRMMRADGRVQSAQLMVDRTGEDGEIRRCVVSRARRVTLAERALPALPPLDGFSFDAHVLTRANRSVERWRYTLSGHPGELGAVRGEALTFRHELLLARDADGLTVVPLRYSVEVDSSVLGVNSDGYVHHYDEVDFRNHDPNLFHLEVSEACERVEATDRMERVEPLREFTMLRRDPAHDVGYMRFKRRYGHRYADDTEEAVRKTVLVHTTRYQSSGNREGATFEMDINHLSDRLRAEVELMTGSSFESGAYGNAMAFPHSSLELDAVDGRLPARFDWRRRGGVTAVRTQIKCECCWAIAATGAIEGALFAQTGRLVQLSEQAVVDCAHPYGGHGCRPAWPRSAFDYAKHQGLPAYDEYTYKDKLEPCNAARVQPVTRITGYYNVTPGNINAIKMAIKRHGPTLVIIDATMTPSFVNYKRGFYSDGRCKQNSPNHAVLAVGWTKRKSTGETYLILKNSWSPKWGEEGYMRLRAEGNTCGVLSRASVPLLQREDVLRVPASAAAAAPTL